MSNVIWTVEHRKNNETHTENTLGFIASSVEKALEWINQNQDYDYGDFWWYVNYEEVDTDSETQNRPEKDHFIFNKKGEELLWQPATGENVIYYGDKVLFVLNYVHEGLNDEHTFEGVLLNANRTSVYMKDVVIVEDPEHNIKYKKIGEQLLQPEQIHFIKSL